VTAVVLIIVHLLAWVWLVWSMGMLLRLRRENDELRRERDRLSTAVIEATAALNARAERSGNVVRMVQRERALRDLPGRIFGDAEGRN
jgi:type VI protein secretion system component VasK